MAKIIGIYSRSKGCGKTVTAAYLAAGLRAAGKKVATVDCNGDLTNLFQSDSVDINFSGLTWKNFDIKCFLQTFEEITNKKDYILVDFPNYKHEDEKQLVEKLNSVIIPLESEFYGLDDLTQTLDLFLENKSLPIEGILLNKCNQSTIKLKTKLESYFDFLVFNTLINRNYYLALNSFSLKKNAESELHTGFIDYCKLAIEIIENEY